MGMLNRGIFSKMLLLAGCFSLGISTLISCKSETYIKKDVPKEVILGYSQIVFATYSDALSTAELLKVTIDSFVANPSPETQESAKKAWKLAREVYGKTEAFRFYDGPIDNGKTGVEGLLNAWPLDEVYVDYIEAKYQTGIINNLTVYPEISKDLLISLNEKGGEENISTGYHAIEFLLWGQDLSADGPGARPYSDYLPQAKNANRRKLYLQAATELLIDNLRYLTEQWKEGDRENYRHDFENLETNVALQKILTGMAVLSKVEMAGERMFTAYDNKNQEDEQSCFSDNTKADLVNNLGGIIDIFYGTYIRIDKTTLQVKSIGDLLKASNPSIYVETENQIKTCMDDLLHIYHPFDQAIVLEDKRPAVMTGVLSMQKLGNQFAKVADGLKLTIDINDVN